MNKSSVILLTNLAIFTVYLVYGKSKGDVFFLMVWITIQFVVNLLAGVIVREGKPAYFLSACLVLVIGFAVCVNEFQ